MKKVLIVFLVLLTVSLSLFGSGRDEYRGTRPDSFYYRFGINNPDRIENNKIFISELVLKPGFVKYKKTKQKDLNIYPLFNLDIYVMKENSRKNVSDFRVSVPITISREFIQRATGLKMTEDYNLFVYINKKIGWIPISDPKSGIKDIRKKDATFDFTIVDWPVDDRMIGCGH